MVATLEKDSPCKVNLLLNILGKRRDGFHELETVMHPVAVFDKLTFNRRTAGIKLTCSNPLLPTDSRNLVYAAASKFLEKAKVSDGVAIHLDKNIPLVAGLGGGSGNAATTLLGLNELFDSPLSESELHSMAAELGSDVPFFLQSKPALATGRGESIQPLVFFPALRGAWFVLAHPGFGISTAWCYRQLQHFPDALNGKPGRAQRLVTSLQNGEFDRTAFNNSLEAPAFEKFPLLPIFREFFLANGATAALMS